MAVNKEKFIDLAQSLDGSYFDYGRCLYLITHNKNIDEQIFDYMLHNASNVREVDEKVYELLGKPDPMPAPTENVYSRTYYRNKKTDAKAGIEAGAFSQKKRDLQPSL